MGTMSVMDRTGDYKVIWTKGQEAEVSAAKATFDDLIGKGYLAYSVDEKGDKNEIVREFNEDLEKLIMAPAPSGG